MPKVSIIIPCYNHGAYIREALQSVDAVTDKTLYEIIIVNDGSTDAATVEILSTLEQEGYYVLNQTNQGLGAARNNGIKLAKGTYVLPLDSDNRIRPAYIEEGAAYLDGHPEIAMVYGDAEYFGEQTGVHTVGAFNLQRIMLGNYIDACALYRKSVWEALGGYDQQMPVMGLEDWELWLRMSFNGYQFHYINKVLYDYRVMGTSMLRTVTSNRRGLVVKYLHEKYKDQLNYPYVNELMIADIKNNKKLIPKLLLAVFFPCILSWMEKKKMIRDKKIFM